MRRDDPRAPSEVKQGDVTAERVCTAENLTHTLAQDAWVIFNYSLALSVCKRGMHNPCVSLVDGTDHLYASKCNMLNDFMCVHINGNAPALTYKACEYICLTAEVRTC